MFNKKIILAMATTLLLSANLLGCTKEAVNTDQPSRTDAPIAATPNNSTSNDGSNHGLKEDAPSEVSFYGRWKINKAAAFAPVGTYSTEDIEQLLNREVTFTETSATGFGDSPEYLNTSIVNPKYNQTTILKADFEQNNRVTFEQLDISGDSIIEVVASDDDGNRTIFYIKDQDTLLLYGGGVFIELVRL